VSPELKVARTSNGPKYIFDVMSKTERSLAPTATRFTRRFHRSGHNVIIKETSHQIFVSRLMTLNRTAEYFIFYSEWMNLKTLKAPCHVAMSSLVRGTKYAFKCVYLGKTCYRGYLEYLCDNRKVCTQAKLFVRSDVNAKL